ncbi:hypothetical protein RRG08_002847 [Elysia crispata]|uniref:Uncharacterized protein n=1 Tax=Elysia crispata TaxID=231223 RepID=A0AAE0XU18_9GAST|nr:hypothetical protein RRG08_002847 [Elysia crispata]
MLQGSAGPEAQEFESSCYKGQPALKPRSSSHHVTRVSRSRSLGVRVLMLNDPGVRVIMLQGSAGPEAQEFESSCYKGQPALKPRSSSHHVTRVSRP